MAADEFFDPTWQEHFLETMAGMIAQNEDEIRRNARWLTVAQVTLVAGVTAIVGAVAI